jgi:DNA-binding LacI/PurR family transcriptional regulator
MGIVDVARVAGVSTATVSRVLNESDYPVRPDTREKVVEAAKRLGFHPNGLARGLLLKRTETVGLIIPDITNPYYPQISRGVEDVAAKHSYTVVFCNTDRDALKSERYVEALLRRRVDGVVIAGGGTDFEQATNLFSDHNAEVVLIGRHRLPFPSVQVDNFRAARKAVSHLVGLGHSRIGFITGPLNLTSARDRLRGYKAALKSAGIAPDNEIVAEGDYTEKSGYTGGLRVLDRRGRATGILAANDRIAIGAMAAAADIGLNVPADISVIGFDDITMASFVRPALTTVAIPAYEMGEAAMAMLIKLIQQEAHPRVIKLPAELVVRESSGPPPASKGETSKSRRLR